MLTVWRRVLTPFQVAQLTVQTYPLNADILAMIKCAGPCPSSTSTSLEAPKFSPPPPFPTPMLCGRMPESLLAPFERLQCRPDDNRSVSRPPRPHL